MLLKMAEWVSVATWEAPAMSLFVLAEICECDLLSAYENLTANEILTVGIRWAV